MTVTLPAREKRVDLAFQNEVIDLAKYRTQLEDIEAERQKLKKSIAQIEAEITRAELDASRSGRIITAMEVWKNEQELIKGLDMRDWSEEIVRSLRYQVIMPLIKTIYVTEGEKGLSLEVEFH